MLTARRLAVACLLVHASLARAIDVPPPGAAGESRLALESTLDVTSKHGGSLDASATYAPFGAIYDSGLRLRMAAGGSWYRYVANDDPRAFGDGHGGELDLLAGYGLSTRRVSFIGLVGAALNRSDDEGTRNSSQGAKFVLSAYATPTDWTMAYVSLTHSTIATTSLFQAKVGAKMTPGFYVGPEVNATWRHGSPFDTHSATRRIGVHLSSMKLGPWYLSASAGWLRDRDLGSGGYVGVSSYGGF